MSLRQKLRIRMWLFLLQTNEEDGDQNEEEDGQYGYDSYGTPTSVHRAVDYHTGCLPQHHFPTTSIRFEILVGGFKFSKLYAV